MSTRSSKGKVSPTPPDESCGKGVTNAQAKPGSKASSPRMIHPPGQLLQAAGTEHVVVAVVRLLPAKVRERFCYACLGAALLALGLGLFLAPQATLAGGSGVALLSWVKRMFGR